MMAIFLLLTILWQTVGQATSFSDNLSLLEKQSNSLEKTIHNTAWDEATDVARTELTQKAEAGLTALSAAQSSLNASWTQMMRDLRVGDRETQRLVSYLSQDSQTQAAKDAPSTELSFPMALTMLRSYVLAGDPTPLQAFIEHAVANSRLVYYELVFTHALFLSNQLPSVPLTHFQLYTLLPLQRRMDLTRALIAGFPDVSFGSLRTASGQINFHSLIGFLSGFSTREEASIRADFNKHTSLDLTAISRTLNLSEESVSRLLNAIAMAEATTKAVESYYAGFYPQAFRFDALEFLAAMLIQVPGLHECINLTRGLSDQASSQNPIRLSDFEGAPCDFTTYRGALLNFERYYSHNNAWNLVSTIRDFFTTAPEIFPGFPPAPMAESLTKLVLEFTPESDPLHRLWPQIRNDLFEGVGTAAAWAARDPLTLDRDIKALLRAHAVNPTTGFDADYSENLSQIRHLLKNLEVVETQEPITTVNSQSECDSFTTGQSSEQRVAQTLREAAIAPWPVESSHGFSRLARLYEIRLGNLHSIQNTEPVSTTLAGIIQSTALTQLLTNAIYTQWITGQSLAVTPEQLGIRMPFAGYLELVNERYRFTDPVTVIGQATAAASALNSHDLRRTYRAQIFQAASKIRELDAWITKLNTPGAAARMAPPGLSQILNIPVENTGESDPTQATRLNQTLIDLVGYVRWDYLKRNNPGISIGTLRQLNKATRLTIDQFKEQIDWYSGIENGRIEGPPRQTDFIGHDELALLHNNPIIQGLLLNHVSAMLDIPRDYAIWAKEVLIARWPMLTLINTKTGKKTDLWKSYRDQDFETVTASHLQMIVETANSLLSGNSLEDLFDVSIPNSSLIDYVLRRHPDQKLSVCKQQQRLRHERAQRKRISLALNTTALALSLIPAVGPEAAFIPGALAIAITAYDSSKTRNNLAQAHAYQFATLAQRSDSERANDTINIRQLENEYYDAITNHAISIAALATGGAIRFSRMAHILGSFNRALSYSRLSAVRFSQQWAARIGQRWSASISAPVLQSNALQVSLRAGNLVRKGLTTVGEGVLFPLHRLGLTASHSRQWQLLCELTPGITRWQKVLIRTGHAVEDSAHLVVNLPLLPLGAQWGSGVGAKYLALYSTYEMGNWALHSWKAYRLAARQLTIERLNRKIHDETPMPEYTALLNALYEGTITMDDAATILETDRRYGYQDALDTILQSSDQSDSHTTANMLNNLKGILEKSLSPPPDNPQHAGALKRALNDVRRAQLSFPLN